MEESFGSRLKQYRQMRDLTQADLAEQVGCAAESIRKMESNRQRPSKFLAGRLADMLAVPAEAREEFLILARARIAAASAPAHSPAPRPGVVNLPAQMTSLVGRQQDLTAVCKLLLNPDIRLVTLTGPGGVGKTRLAAQISLKLLKDFPDGVYFVPLAAITDVAFVASAIAQVLHIRVTSEQFSVHFGAHLGQKRILLVLDNFEHVMSATSLIVELLTVAPALRILVTSRTTLSLYGEHEWNVSPLSLPNLKSLPPSAQLTQFEAVRIFVERTRALNIHFALTDANAAAVAEICCRLDGLPLALELAAAYGKLLSPPMLLQHLKEEPIGLASSASNLPERHSTLRNTIQWGYQLLNPGEQAVFQQLSVFLSGCTLEAAGVVCGLQKTALLKQIGSLLDKSLLQQVNITSEERRYVMLDTIRSYALEELEQSGQQAPTRDRHLAYYLKLAEKVSPRLSAGTEPQVWLAHLERELGNLRAAIQWAIQQQNWQAVVQLCSSLEYFWYEFGDPDELYQWMYLAVQNPANLPGNIRTVALRFIGYILMSMKIDYRRAKVFFEESLHACQLAGDQAGIVSTLARLSIVTLELGDGPRAQSLAEEFLAISETIGDAKGVRWAREWLAVVWMRQGQFDPARQVFAESAAWWRQESDLGSEAFALINLGAVAMYQGNYPNARDFLEKALALFTTIGDRRGVSAALNALGPVALYQGDPLQAAAFLCKSLSLRWETQDYNGIAWNMERLAEVAFSQKNWRRGAQLWGAAEVLREKYHSPLFPADVRRYTPAITAAQSVLGEAGWKSTCAVGRSSAIEEMVRLALGDDGVFVVS